MGFVKFLIMVLFVWLLIENFRAIVHFIVFVLSLVAKRIEQVVISEGWKGLILKIISLVLGGIFCVCAIAMVSYISPKGIGVRIDELVTELFEQVQELK